MVSVEKHIHIKFHTEDKTLLHRGKVQDTTAPQKAKSNYFFQSVEAETSKHLV